MAARRTKGESSGRPKSTAALYVRLPPELLSRLDAWCAKVEAADPFKRRLTRQDIVAAALERVIEAESLDALLPGGSVEAAPGRKR